MRVYVKYNFLLLLFFLVISPNSYAEEILPNTDAYDLPKVVAVQNRNYFLDKDLTFNFGLLPSDAFNKGVVFGVSYTHFFKDYLAWEVVNANYNYNMETALKKDFESLNISVQDTAFEQALDYITYYLSSNIVYTPLYMKSLLFNDTVVRGETSFVFGGGAVHFKDHGLNMLLTLGLYIRFITEEDRSWKFDFRNNIYFAKNQGAVNAWSFTVGYSMQLGDSNKVISQKE